MGHEYVGVVEEIGSEVKTMKPGDFVVGSLVISDNTCEICEAGFPARLASQGRQRGRYDSMASSRSAGRNQRRCKRRSLRVRHHCPALLALLGLVALTGRS